MIERHNEDLADAILAWYKRGEFPEIYEAPIEDLEEFREVLIKLSDTLTPMAKSIANAEEVLDLVKYLEEFKNRVDNEFEDRREW